MSEVVTKAKAARETTAALNNLTTEQKNEALILIADALLAAEDRLLAANEEDIVRGRAQGTSESLLDRLKLTPQRLQGIAQGVREVVELPDPVGETLQSFDRPNGLSIEQRRVPLGVIGMIYEARPNVTVDAASLCLKTGNAVVLRGGSAALSSNRAIVEVMREALSRSALPADALQLIEDSDRKSVDEMLKLNGLLDVIIPRGGASLIQNVVQNATVPVIETGAGICHTFADASADYAMAEAIALNAKVQRPSVCNSMETLLLHEAFASEHLAALADKFTQAGVKLKGCEASRKLVPSIETATAEDYATEYNDYILNLKIVKDVDEALAHIRKFGTQHSECIVTEDAGNAERFLQEVDAAAVYHNASTRFTDGFEFGFGAEIGISTQKLHARGPMGLPALTSTKYRIVGSGQIRA
ncbi:glutamate-5-semialdehyde dehydrogenase [Cohnella sp. CIP 111063]|jgi:glutamate-5-semialdehyde dehydrogenase|uniref:glutamate-5-semialdehyde dehydrogenase n=1 Tax=unclassified Cohnella TaxID=2636738 RepID=UPI000B8C52DA|nr:MULTISPECIES: glutamate-5-semialdehyde dehydrogenase [unclassified Cohnella]OXS61144.1 glutamate-5-semialdehyde dehydrogenase [Cohnella sp. CIP 111063]PRX73698.1 glutamate-5-semialdehyde dehydrogenase [Cohnella sp. SGD-V74]